MLRCLNPKKAHENRGAPARPVPSGPTIALSVASSSNEEEEQVACQYCKYLLEGAILGDCRILRWIGSGAFGDVYEAVQLPPLNRRVAIKVMAIERVMDGESAEMFAREVGTIAALDHPNILPVLRVGMIEDGRSYLVMKYAAQGSLQQFCQPVQPAISMLPTSNPAHIAEAPGDALLVASSETVSIAEVIEEQNAAQDSAVEEEQTVRRAPQVLLRETEEGEEARAAANAAPAGQTAEAPACETPLANGNGVQEETLAEEAPALPALETLAADEAPAQEATGEAQAGGEEMGP